MNNLVAQTVVPENPVRMLHIEPVGKFSAALYADCGECPALCCSAGVEMSLTSEEATAMEEAGTVLTALSAASRKRRFSLRGPETKYRLETDCGNLVRKTEGGPGVCAAFEDKNRPKICGQFVVGQYGCMNMRLKSGEINADEYNRFDAATIA